MNTKGKTMKLLIVEDNRMVQLALEEMLKSFQNCLADFAEDGKTALDLFSQKIDYDLVLMDINLPDIDGITITKTIRKTEKGRNIPIIAMTSLHEEADYQKQFLSAGMNGSLGKPTMAQLQALIHEYTPLQGTY